MQPDSLSSQLEKVGCTRVNSSDPELSTQPEELKGYWNKLISKERAAGKGKLIIAYSFGFQRLKSSSLSSYYQNNFWNKILTVRVRKN